MTDRERALEYVITLDNGALGASDLPDDIGETESRQVPRAIYSCHLQQPNAFVGDRAQCELERTWLQKNNLKWQAEYL